MINYELLGELSAYKSVHNESFYCKKILKYNCHYFESCVQRTRSKFTLNPKAATLRTPNNCGIADNPMPTSAQPGVLRVTHSTSRCSNSVVGLIDPST